ncbi:MAG: hypothetical protein GVY36_09120 [Verrucomicrobia bacterium]|jgi:N-acetylglucosamine kinase-like BadF-type ATPase|nr:hypothetical protein [Verrucomicrobiota bacterium]
MYFLGIDGGGSQARALLADEAGNILGEGRSGPCNPCTQSEESCFEQLQSAIQGAFVARCRESGFITAAHLGVAGAGDPSARMILESVADQLFDRNATQVGISHDLKIGHAGGLVGQAGCALVAGTGSACYGVNSQGKEVLTGGWGDLVDDAGSGGWIGLRALQLCLRQADGRAPGNDLQRGVLRFLGLESIEQIKRRIHIVGLSRDERAKLAPVIFDLAQSGDAMAKQIVEEAVRELTLLVQCNFKKLSFNTPQLVVLGGLTNSIYFRERLAASIQAVVPSVAITQPRLSANAGAVLLAMQAAGVRVDEAVFGRMSNCLT